jgi:hypothetical protein
LEVAKTIPWVSKASRKSQLFGFRRQVAKASFYGDFLLPMKALIPTNRPNGKNGLFVSAIFR